MGESACALFDQDLVGGCGHCLWQMHDQNAILIRCLDLILDYRRRQPHGADETAELPFLPQIRLAAPFLADVPLPSDGQDIVPERDVEIVVAS